MSPAYKSLVKLYYKKKKGEHALPSGLMYPTPASLRDECLAALRRGILKKDRKVLFDYFGENGDDEAIFKKIRKYDIEGFKPIQNFLKKEDGSTDPKKVELLAWLIGFEDRPYDDRKEYLMNDLQTKVNSPGENLNVAKNEEEKEEQAEQVEENKIPEIEVVEEPPQLSASVISDKSTTQVDDVKERAPLVASPQIANKQRTNPKNIIAALVAILLAAGIFIYTGNGGNGLKNLMGGTLNKGEGCMYWAEDHYQQVPCNQKMGDILVIALDTEKLNSFKKITREDTITNNDIGRVWYIKLNNKVEFYTSSGNYPLDPTRRLKPITEHIISAYIVTKQ